MESYSTSEILLLIFSVSALLRICRTLKTSSFLEKPLKLSTFSEKPIKKKIALNTEKTIQCHVLKNETEDIKAEKIHYY